MPLPSGKAARLRRLPGTHELDVMYVALMGMSVGRVTSIVRYPVKSVGGEPLVDVDIDENGVLGDRLWACRDVESDRLVSAKRPRLWRSMLECAADGFGDDVAIRLPDGSVVAATDPATWDTLSTFLGRQVTLERSEIARQGVYASDWPEIDGLTLKGEVEAPTNLTGRGTNFVDVEPIHFVTSASLSALSDLDPELDVDIRRFRPNIVIDTPGLSGFAENGWEGHTMEIGTASFAVLDPTARCVMTTVEQNGLPRQNGILQALARENRHDYKMGTFAAFGSYAAIQQVGAISVGDEVVID